VRFASVVVLACCFAAAPASATTLYTWVDAQGRTQYSDRPPVDFKGEVRRIETDAAPPAAAPAVMPPPSVAPAAEPVPKAAPAPQDMAARRRATRERLEAEVSAARAKLEAARKALAAGQEAEPDERQLVHRPLAPEPGKPGVGVPTALQRNCRVAEGAGGRKTIACPVSVPTDAYFERVQELEEAVRRAEADLDAAQLAYRRGVD
jgi:uncharacterized protein DUF4124